MDVKRTPIIAAVAITAGLICVPTVVPAPAQAAPGCIEWGFPLQNTLLASGGLRLNGEPAPTNDDWSLSWTGQAAGVKSSIGTGTLTGFRDKPPLPGELNADLTPGGNGGTLVHISFDAADRSVSFTLDGAMSPEGNIVGSSESGGGNISWRMAAPFQCIKLGEAAGAVGPKAAPTITSDQVIGGIVIHVKNNTPDTTACHYDSEAIDRNFTLKPDATTDLRLVPAVPLFTTWHVTVTCDNGAKGEADIDF